ncbi:MAG TPA: hypothetical protein VIB38_02240, partial [Aestuariivirgaceae bacterium]
MCDEILEHFLILQRIHRTPEAFMFEGQELIVLHQSAKRFLDQLLAIVQIFEDVPAKNEEPAIDPKIGILRRSYIVHFSSLIHLNEMQAEVWARGNEAGDLTALAKRLDHQVEINVAQPVAVIGKKHFFVLDMLPHRVETLAYAAPYA